MNWDEIMQSSEVRCAYFAVVLLLVLIVFMHVLKLGWYYKELLANKPNYIYASGPDLRFQSQQTGSNQGASSQHFTVDIDTKGDQASERLTASQDGMDLWAVGSDLSAYKAAISGQTTGLKVNRNGMHMEKMTTENMQDDVYEKLLHQSLLAGA